MKRILSLLVAISPPFVAAADDHATRMGQSLSLFTSEVRTTLVENCLKCHGGDKVRSEFNLATREGLLAGGDVGISVIPGDAKNSPLFNYLTHQEEPYMPPKKPPLSEEEITAIAKWIDLGAAYDSPLAEAREEKAPMQVTDTEREYWAFAPLRAKFPANASVDSFVHAKHTEKKLTTAPQTSKRTLIRRAHFDLTGLPPERQAIDAFLADESPEAYEKLVDHLLASPRFGERWARHWLDVARFAESHGFEHDYDRKFAFHYRDFVIRAFNDDLPYDQFVRWQLAGDELAPDNPLALMATGFLGAGVYPTQITISEAERVRYDAMDDMLATTGSAMLATTVGCARCHDHKYDPIPTRDYYQMLSAFKTTVRTEVDLDLSLLDREKATNFAKKQADAKEDLASYAAEGLHKAFVKWTTTTDLSKAGAPAQAWTVLTAKSITGTGGVTFEELPDGSYLATGANPGRSTYTFTTRSDHGNPTAIRLEALADQSMVKNGPGRAGNGNIQLTGFEVAADGKKIELRSPRATFQQNENNLSIASTIDGNKATGWALDPQFGKNHAAIFEIANPSVIKVGAELKFTMRFDGNASHTIGRPRLSLSDAPPAKLEFTGGANPRITAMQTIRKLLLQAGNESSPKQLEQMLEHFKVLDPEYQKLAAKLATVDASRENLRQKVMICSEGDHIKPMRHHKSSGSIPDFYKESYFLSRGDPKQKDGVAEPGFLQVLSRPSNQWPAGSEDERTSGNRAALSRWMTDAEHGAGHLLARVIVNRLWQHHFGRGIVATPNDFGFQGERPTHPVLLDWLATELISNGWHLKPIHKLIMNSETYRMADLESATNQEIDLENHFLWHRPPRRLEAEAIRDSALAVGGILDTKMYGAGTLDENSKRRSIYFMVKRSQLVPTMQMFDWPDTLTSLGRRAITTTPSQALIFINHPQFRKMAEGFAQRIAGENEPVVKAYQLAYGRQPSRDE
ncbi:MAG: mono/diheme cytochrome c family protein, partial [Pseudoalteromonas tetraodonis]